MMQTSHYRLSSSLLVLTILTLSDGQTAPYITEPRLTSVTPINSTALTVTWQFADSSVDTSDLIRISIVFYEYYYSYNQVYPAINYTFTPANKTVTSLMKNFELVNAYYYVCFSSNSTVTNVSRYLAIVNNCVLARTCSRANTSCSGPSSVSILPANITSTSFRISFYWPNDLPYSAISFVAQLTSNNQVGTALAVTQNTTFTTRPYQFTNLQPRTTYTVNASFTYAALFNVTGTNTTLLTVTTSCSTKVSHTSATLFALSVISFFIFY